MSGQYDEPIVQNPFFQELQENHNDIIERATQEGWIICVPRIGTFQQHLLTTDDLFNHILVPSIDLPDTHFCTLTNRQLSVCDKTVVIEPVDHETTTNVSILFDETFYIDNTHKYKVWCVENPLIRPSNDSANINSHYIHVCSLSKCIELLWSENLGHDLLKFIELTAKKYEFLENENIQLQKDLAIKLYTVCIGEAFKCSHVQEKTSRNPSLSDNIKVAVETYLQHQVHKKLFKAVQNCVSHVDAAFNKMVRNLSDVHINDLSINPEFYDNILCAKHALGKINRYTTVLDKIYCLKNTLNTLTVPPTNTAVLTSDDLLQVFVFLILKLKLNNWCTNLVYVTQFQFSRSNVTDENAFLVTTFEAAIEYIKSGALSRAVASKIKSTSLPLQAASGAKPSQNSLASLYEQIRLGNVNIVKNILDEDERNNVETRKHDDQLCHPLCSCSACEKLISTTQTCSLNSCDEKGLTPLHMASMHGQIHIVEYLISRGVDIDVCDSANYTPLHYSALRGHQDTLLLLLHCGADINILDCDKNSPLHLAALNGHENCIKALLYFSENKIKGIDINHKNNYGETALHIASNWGYTMIVHNLLQYGANPNIRNKRHEKAVEFAHNYYITKLLETASNYQTNVEVTEKDGWEIVNNNNKPPEEECDEQCGTINSSKCYGVRPKNHEQMKKTDLLIKAIQNNDLPLTCYYLGIPSPRTFTSPNNQTSCHPLCDCETCQPFQADELLQNVATGRMPLQSTDHLNINICNTEGYTSLHIASQYGRTEILRVLLDSGASINLQTNAGHYTALHLACQYQRIQVIRELIKCGDCHVDVQDDRGNTPLHYACLNNNARIVEILLSHGCDRTIRNNRGKTVEQEANEKLLFSIFKLLKNPSKSCSKPNDDLL